jgi:hypothetical protein
MGDDDALHQQVAAFVEKYRDEFCPPGLRCEDALPHMDAFVRRLHVSSRAHPHSKFAKMRWQKFRDMRDALVGPKRKGK